jgi:aspartyl-tRNA(Asn)/glutamyl-tRNA(Gln) amidotransferase subunit C
MAEITKETVEYLARLCRIHCKEEKLQALLHDLQNIVSYVDQLSQVDTEGVEPCNYVIEGHGATPLREDIPQNTLSREDFLKGAPKHVASLVQVPSIIKGA